ncbi:MAG TPA: hypothetical protein VF895_09675 [Gaiellaceae bacterium]
MKIHAVATIALSVLLVTLGTAIVIRTALLGGGMGFGLGAIVLCAGVLRLYYSRT